MVPLTAACITAVALAYAPVVGDPVPVLEQDLYALLSVEGGKVGECVPNKDRAGRVTSRDCEPFQINTSNGPMLAGVFGTTTEEAMRRVTDDRCLNAHVAGWILVEKRRAAKGDRRDALGRYNSATPRLKEVYLGRVDQKRQRLFGKQAFHPDAAVDEGRR